MSFFFSLSYDSLFEHDTLVLFYFRDADFIRTEDSDKCLAQLWTTDAPWTCGHSLAAEDTNITIFGVLNIFWFHISNTTSDVKTWIPFCMISVSHLQDCRVLTKLRGKKMSSSGVSLKRSHNYKLLHFWDWISPSVLLQVSACDYCSPLSLHFLNMGNGVISVQNVPSVF